jgi:hypothetical protein
MSPFVILRRCMQRQDSKAKFWTILTLTNLLLMIYPVTMYVNADSDGAQVLAAIVMVSIAFIMAIADVVGVVCAYAG